MGSWGWFGVEPSWANGTEGSGRRYHTYYGIDKNLIPTDEVGFPWARNGFRVGLI